MTELLAKSDEGALVSLELLDDIAVQGSDGEVSLVQSKSALTANPVSDRAIPLWKTLGNWAQDLPKDTDFSKLTLVMAVSNPRTGGCVSAFNNAATTDEARKVISEAEKEFASELSSKDSTEKDLSFHLKRFFRSVPAHCAEIIRCFRLETCLVSPQQDLPRFFPFMTEDVQEDVVTHAQGWVKRQAELLLEAGKPAILSRDDFYREMTSYIRKRRERAILRSFAPAEIPKDKEAELLPRLFVRQLEIVDLDFSDRLQAVSDYFRATFDRTKWGESAEVHPSSFTEFDDNLERAWRNLQRQCALEHKSLAEEERGQMLLSRCCAHTAQLEGQGVPNHFVPGTFHHLSDEQKIGWHPRYSELLTETAAAAHS